MAPSRRQSVGSDHAPKSQQILEQLEDIAPAQAQDEERTVWQELKHVKPLFPRLFIIYVCVISIGVDNGLAGLTLGIPSFRRQFGSFLNEDAGYVVPANYTSAWAGASVGMQTIGAMLSGYLADKIGRRWCLRISSIIVIISATLMVAAREIGLLIASKGILGLGTGFLVAQSAPYLAECATPRLRGMAIIGINAFLVFGQWLGAFLIWACSEGFPDVQDNTAWLLVFGLQFIFPTLFLLLSFWLPESPIYLVQRGKVEEATAAAKMLFGEAYDYKGHIAKAVLEVQAENETADSESISFWEPCRKTDLRRTLIGILVIVGQILTGNLFILAYQNYFYELAKIPGSNALTVGSYSVSIVANICSYFVIETVGRRPLYTYGTLILSLSNFIVGFMDLLQDSQPKTAGAVAVFGLYLWSFTYQATVGPVAWAVAGEIPSNRLRAKTNSWINLVNSLASFGLSFAIPQLFNPDALNLGLKMGYIFGAASMILFVLAWFFLPETKNRTSWELDRLFEAKISARRFKGTKFDEFSMVDQTVSSKDNVKA